MKTTRTPCALFLGHKGAAAADVSDHSLLLCSSSSSPSEEEGVCFSFTRHPFISLLIPLSLCVLATEVNIHDFGVCFPPNGLTIASMMAPLTTSWYFLTFQFSSQDVKQNNQNFFLQDLLIPKTIMSA